MSASSKPILIFGAAGGVGRYVAQSTAAKGAPVWLAMRDTKKTIPGLSPSTEKDFNMQRIQADLTSPSTLTSAVNTSGATTAFVYAISSSEDGMKSAFETLKDAGISFIVFLSAFAVRPTADAAKSLDMLPRMHAEIEINLRESGIPYVAIRPAYFNTNLFFMQGYKAGAIRAYGVDAVHDFIAPEDIGDVAATLLTSPPGPQPDHAIYLCGPQLTSIRDAIGVVGEVLGRGIEVQSIDEEEYVRTSTHFPKPMLESLMKLTKMCTPPNTGRFYDEASWKQAVENVRKFAEKEPMSLKAWVEKHKDEFK